MTRTISVASFFLLIAAPSWALSFGTGCANPCGAEELVRGSAAACTIVVGTDAGADEPVLVADAYYVVHHADGDETVGVDPTTIPRLLMPGDHAEFPASVMADASDVDRLTMAAIGVLEFEYPTGPVSVGEFFPDAVTIVDQSTCSITTTTETTTTTSTSLTTTTVQTVLGFPRLRVCTHNSQPKKCP